MAFSDFTYPSVVTEFGLTEANAELFPQARPVAPSAALQAFLNTNLALAATGNTAEKARSELLVSPVLSELWSRYKGRISLYSGAELTADPDARLTGYCDFLIGRGPQLPRLIAPAIVVIEAKRDNIENGYGQCIAGMVGIQRFNRRAGQPDAPVFGGVTTGMNWKFLRLDGSVLTYDEPEYGIQPIERLLGVLSAMVEAFLESARPLVTGVAG